MRTLTGLLTTLVVFTTGGCRSEVICARLENDPACSLTVQGVAVNGMTIAHKPETPIELKKLIRHTIFADVTGGPKTEKPINLQMLQEGMSPVEFVYAGGEEAQYRFTAEIPIDISKKIRIGAASIELRSSDEERSMLWYIPLKWSLKPQSYVSVNMPTKSTATAPQIPRAEQLGMQDGILYVASSGYSGTTKFWTVDKYQYQPSPMAFSKLPMDYLRGVVLSQNDRLQLSVVEGKPEGSAYLSHKTQDSSLALTVCPVREAKLELTTCQSDTQMSLPPGTQAMVVSREHSRIVRAEANGALFWAPVSPPIAVGGWKQIGTTGAGVRLAVTDLNFDGQSDVVAVWGSGGSQQAAAYLASDAGYTQDPDVSKQLTLAIGSESITALAAGDMDRDGYGDVVIAQKQKLVVLQSQLERFEPVWSTTVDPELGKTQIDAIALGRMESGIADGKQLDIVTASNTAYDGMDNLTMYLHAFRPMP